MRCIGQGLSGVTDQLCSAVALPARLVVATAEGTGVGAGPRATTVVVAAAGRTVAATGAEATGRAVVTTLEPERRVDDSRGGR